MSSIKLLLLLGLACLALANDTPTANSGAPEGEAPVEDEPAADEGEDGEITLDGGDEGSDDGDDKDIILDGADDEPAATDAPATTAAPATTDAPAATDAPPEEEEEEDANTACFDAVANKPTEFCSGTCEEGIKTTGMEAEDSVCTCKSGRFGRNCASIPKKSGAGLSFDWSEDQTGKVIKAKQTPHKAQLRGVYLVADAAECEDICVGLNSGYDKRRRMPCGAITVVPREADTLCEIYKVRPTKACGDWLVDGEGDTKWLVDVTDDKDPLICSK